MEQWRVLIIEDDSTVARIHCRFVSRQAGFSVIGVAASVAQAEALLANLRPHLVLLDLELPGASGMSLLRKLRTTGDCVEVVVVSAHANAKVVRAAVQLGVVDYLIKPFWPARLSEGLHAFRTRMETVGGRSLDQAGVDRLRTGADEARSAAFARSATRKRMDEVQATLAAQVEAVSAEQLAALMGVARVTARRYLEHLVAVGRCTVDEVSDGPGRPRKFYRPWLPGRAGAPPPASSLSR